LGALTVTIPEGASPMQLQVKVNHDSVSDSVRAYAEKRLAKLSRRLYEGTVVEVTLSREHNPSIRDDHVAEGVVFTKGPNLVAREAATSYEAAVDKLVDKLERQIERYRDKRVHEPRRAAQRKRDAEPGDEPAGTEAAA
jgi:putative sigma-54 modulation protein